jgi:formylglycine-generating enzyme required for sulfatase activity
MRHRVHSATTGGEGEGRGHNGGVWEWSSTVFDGYKGFEPSYLYPGFSADFYDTLHNVVVSGISFTFFSDMC